MSASSERFHPSSLRARSLPALPIRAATLGVVQEAVDGFRERRRVIAFRVNGRLTSRSPRLGEVERDDRSADCHVLGHLDEVDFSLSEFLGSGDRQTSQVEIDLRETHAVAHVPGERHVSLEA